MSRRQIQLDFQRGLFSDKPQEVKQNVAEDGAGALPENEALAHGGHAHADVLSGSATWREQAIASLKVRRMTPSQAQENIARLQKKCEAMEKVRIPNFKALASSLPPMPSARGEQASGAPVVSSTTTSLPEGSAKPRSPSPAGSRSPKKSSTLTKPVPLAPHTGVSSDTLMPWKPNFSLHFPNPKALAVSERVILDTLPLERFDVETHDLTPQQWVALGADKGGTPAKALYFQDGNWVWQPCRVLSYDEASGDFELRFTATNTTKYVKRLSILFDQENKSRFFARLEASRRVREESRILCRYRTFIELQPTALFAPIQQSTLHGILATLMLNSKRDVMNNQRFTETLLREVREEYQFASQLALVEYCRRHDIDQDRRVLELNLPPLPELQKPPYYSNVVTLKKAWQLTLLEAFPNVKVSGSATLRPAEIPGQKLIQWVIERKHCDVIGVDGAAWSLNLFTSSTSHVDQDGGQNREKDLWARIGEDVYRAERESAIKKLNALVDSCILLPVSQQTEITDSFAKRERLFDENQTYFIVQYPVRYLRQILVKRALFAKSQHYQVLVAVYKAWWSLKSKCFYDIDPKPTPMTPDEYAKQQEEHLERTRELVINNWITHTSNLLQDNIATTGPSPTRLPFYTLLTFMLRDQLIELWSDSLQQFLEHFRKYADPQLHGYYYHIFGPPVVVKPPPPRILPPSPTTFVENPELDDGFTLDSQGQEGVQGGQLRIDVAAAELAQESADPTMDSTVSAATTSHPEGNTDQDEVKNEEVKLPTPAPQIDVELELGDADADLDEDDEHAHDDEHDELDPQALAQAAYAAQVEKAYSMLPAHLGIYELKDAESWLGKSILLPEPMELLGDYLEGPKASASHRPLLLFKLSVDDSIVTFNPPLESVQDTITKLFSGSQLSYFKRVQDSIHISAQDLKEQPLCDKETTPHIFERFAETAKELGLIIEENFIFPKALSAVYQEYATLLLQMKPADFVQDWFRREAATSSRSSGDEMDDDDEFGYEEDEEPSPEEAKDDTPKHTLEETRQEIQRLLDIIDRITNLSPDEISFRLIRVEVRGLKDKLIKAARDMANGLLDGLAAQLAENCAVITSLFTQMKTRLDHPSQNVAELADLKNRIVSIEQVELPALKERIEAMRAEADCLESFLYQLPKSTVQEMWEAVRYPVRIAAAISDAKLRVDGENRRFQKELEVEQEAFYARLGEASKVIKTLHTLGSAANVLDESMNTVLRMNNTLQELVKQVESFNEREVLFGEEKQEYLELQEVQKQFQPYYDLWHTASLFHSASFRWKSQIKFVEVSQNIQAYKADLNEWYRTMSRLEKDFLAQVQSGQPAVQETARGPLEVATMMRKNMELLRNQLPIVEHIKPRNFQPHHWQALWKLLGLERSDKVSSEDVTLAHILDGDIFKHAQEIETLAVTAEKETQLDLDLTKMRQEWMSVSLRIEPYKKTGTCIIKGYDEIQNRLDDQITKTQIMRSSPYIANSETKAKNWEQRLQMMSALLDQMVRCQKDWTYLEPIFRSEEIMRQIPNEGRRFANIDTTWRRTMELATKMTNYADFVKDNEHLLKSFDECNKSFELIKKSLSDYRNSKRTAYPRFFFLSDDELLQILSDTKNIRAIQNHLPKIFDQLNRLVITPENIITGMSSASGEVVDFVAHVDPNEGAKRGNVELWIADVEQQMRDTVHREIRSALSDYPNQDRNKWIIGPHCQQAILTASQVMWTRDVTNALQRGVKGLQELEDALHQQLDRLVDLVRGDVDKLKRLTLEPLLVLDVKARDIVRHLVEAKVRDPLDFEWLSQLRYYWEPHETKSLASSIKPATGSSTSGSGGHALGEILSTALVADVRVSPILAQSELVEQRRLRQEVQNAERLVAQLEADLRKLRSKEQEIEREIAAEDDLLSTNRSMIVGNLSSNMSQQNRTAEAEKHLNDIRERIYQQEEEITKKKAEVQQLKNAEVEYLMQPQFQVQTKKMIANGHVVVRIINACMRYQYEYLGNMTRLVITPLTDRCFRTLMSAYHLHLGGAPEGPAGTGKTETTKDLSKAVGIQCVVVNGNEGLNTSSMAQFFRGLASTGAWCCFDEFNRIELEVLSVIAQQISTIQRAVFDRRTTFMFEDTQVRLVDTCTVFITMNPGYAGRSELPDNLKTLFRTVAMMIPDYALIAEIKLYSYGYNAAHALARKITGCLRLLSEQLSSQDHYDYGMRNLNAILQACGRYRRELPDASEESLVLRAIYDCNMPKFVTRDISLFKDLISDLFPGVNMAPRDYSALEESCKEVCLRDNIQPTPIFLSKCIEFFDTTQVRHGIMIVGKAVSSKSTILRTVSRALTNIASKAKAACEASRDAYIALSTLGKPKTRAAKEQAIQAREAAAKAAAAAEEAYAKLGSRNPQGRASCGFTEMSVINPKSLTLSQIYGCFEGQEWAEGVLSVITRQAVARTREAIDDDADEEAPKPESKDVKDERGPHGSLEPSAAASQQNQPQTQVQPRALPAQALEEERKIKEIANLAWIVFDGPIDALWVENLNTVLDENKKLCFANSEQIRLTSNMSIVFEVPDLAVASPATVSRSGMVFVEPEQLGWKQILRSWLNTLEAAPDFQDWNVAEVCAAVEDCAIWLLPPTLRYLYENCAMPLPRTATEIVKSCLNLLWTLLVPLKKSSDQEGRAKKRAATRGAAVPTPGSPVPGLTSPAMEETGESVPVGPLYVMKPEQVESLFILAVIWTVGTAMDGSSRTHFSNFIRQMLMGQAPAAAFAPTPGGGLEAFGGFYTRDDEGRLKELVSRHAAIPIVPASGPGTDLPHDWTVYDVYFDINLNMWVPWMKLAAGFTLPSHPKFHEIIVPTSESVRVSWILDRYIDYHIPALLVGATGTGKSNILQTKLLRDKANTRFVPMFIAFTARTKANETRELIQQKLDSRRYRGMPAVGPQAGKQCVICIDDLNMPAPDKYGATPPIELLRQWMDYGGWYDARGQGRKFLHVIDVQFVAAMGPPGGARYPVTPRYLRHFQHINMAPMDSLTMKHVYRTIFNTWVSSFPAKVTKYAEGIINATVHMYEQITSTLLPTPAKAHYMYNLRDVGKVFQGMMEAYKDAIQEGNDLVHLWAHEVYRVFGDRLITAADRVWFDTTLCQAIKSIIHLDVDKIVSPAEIEQANIVNAAARHSASRSGASEGDQVIAELSPLSQIMYADFASGIEATHGGRSYSPVRNLPQLASILNGYRASMQSFLKKDVELVLFDAAIEHITRISRIIRQPYGNALLVGVGGSGKQSLTRLATFIAGFDIFQISMSNSYTYSMWQDDLSSLLISVGCTNMPTVFLLSDAQIKSDVFFEDINTLLNSGEVPNLFKPGTDIYMSIIERCSGDARKEKKAETPLAIYNYFVERCRRNLHIVVCLSPIGEAFRNRIRMFPALVNCCTIDWFHPWPSQALQTVATHYLRDVNIDPKVREGLVDLCVDMQETAQALAADFAKSMGRITYITPSSYLSLIQVFSMLFEDKRTEISAAQLKYETGLTKLNNAATQARLLQEEIERLQPKLQEKAKYVAALDEDIKRNTETVNRQTAIVAVEEQACNEQAETASSIKQECELAVRQAEPMIQKAQEKAAELAKAQSALTVLRGMRQPSLAIQLLAQAMCIMRGIPPERVGPVGNKQDDYFSPFRSLLSFPDKFAGWMARQRGDEISPTVMTRVRALFSHPQFTKKQMHQSSEAAEMIFDWILAMNSWEQKAQEMRPKQAALERAEQAFNEASEALAQKKAQLEALRARLDELKEALENNSREQAALMEQEAQCRRRLDVAVQLIDGLRGEKDRWLARTNELATAFHNVVGNIILASGVIAFLGPFTPSYRERCIKEWIRKLQILGIPCDQNFKIHNVLGDPMQILNWTIQGLPKDDFSYDNAIILTKSPRFPLLIDPQEQASKWICKMEESIEVLKSDDTSNFMMRLCACITNGTPVLIENVGEIIDNALEPLLKRSTFKVGNRLMMRLASQDVEYNPDFRLYLATKLANPRFAPEVSTVTTVINFMITPEGLEDQMLNHAIASEYRELASQQTTLTRLTADSKQKLADIEDRILNCLLTTQGHLLDNQNLVETLNTSNEASKKIEQRMLESRRTQELIEKTRVEFQPLATVVSALFFCVQDLANIDRMYQHSLSWYQGIFHKALSSSSMNTGVERGPTSATAARIKAIETTFVRMLYNAVGRSLYVRHRLLFAFLLCSRLLACRGEIDDREMRFLLTGGSMTIDPSAPPNPTDIAATNAQEYASSASNPSAPNNAGQATVGPASDVMRGRRRSITGLDIKDAEQTRATFEGQSSSKWLSDQSWAQLLELERLPSFNGIVKHVTENLAPWRTFYEQGDLKSIPATWAQRLHNKHVQRLLLFRVFRPDKLVTAIRAFVQDASERSLGELTQCDVTSIYADSNPCTPIILLLSQGVDPLKDILKLAEAKGLNPSDRVITISLGQGQGDVADRCVTDAFDRGNAWVVLQNCHLCQSWLPRLQRIIEGFAPSAATNSQNQFRLWLTTMPCDSFPAPILQSSVKLAIEPPKGIRAIMAQSVRALDTPSDAEGTPKRQEDFRKLYYSLCFFHALVLERRRFGPMGWNNYYQFTEGDLAISKLQLKEFLSMYDAPPFRALKYLIAELNYGGRVTDDWDRRTLVTILDDFVNEDIIEKPNYKFDTAGLYTLPSSLPATSSWYSGSNNITSVLPVEDTADVFGLHDNININVAVSEATTMFELALSLQPKVGGDLGATSGSEGSRDSVLMGRATELEAQIPAEFDILSVSAQYPILYEDSMNTVLLQELERYNRLIQVATSTLRDLKRALKGEILMSDSLEQMANELYDGKVPQAWANVAYPSRKPLGPWMVDFRKRIEMFQTWIQNGPPNVFWFSGFFFTQAFLTGILQNCARRLKIAIDKISFDFQILHPGAGLPNRGDGCFIYGLYLEGARWDSAQGTLTEPRPRQLYCEMPIIWMQPKLTEKVQASRTSLSNYTCPVYKTSIRAGVLTTLGQSSNYVMSVELPSDRPERHWIKRGVALLCQLDT